MARSTKPYDLTDRVLEPMLAKAGKKPKADAETRQWAASGGALRGLPLAAHERATSPTDQFSISGIKIVADASLPDNVVELRFDDGRAPIRRKVQASAHLKEWRQLAAPGR